MIHMIEAAVGWNGDMGHFWLRTAESSARGGCGCLLAGDRQCWSWRLMKWLVRYQNCGTAMRSYKVAVLTQEQEELMFANERKLSGYVVRWRPVSGRPPVLFKRDPVCLRAAVRFFNIKALK